MTAGVQQEDVPDQEVAGVDFTISNDGLARMRLLAPYMAEYEREDTAYTVLSAAPDADSGRVQVLVFDMDGTISATINADRVVFGSKADKYDATGNVIVTTPTGRRLEGEHLAWYESSRKVKTPGFVKITTPNERIQGYNLDAEEDLSRYTLARITGQATVQE
jgi:LPS export ABC transporter protein LptC